MKPKETKRRRTQRIVLTSSMNENHRDDDVMKIRINNQNTKNSSNSQKKSFFPNYFVMHDQEKEAEAK